MVNITKLKYIGIVDNKKVYNNCIFKTKSYNLLITWLSIID